jgi:hypothetical protein
MSLLNKREFSDVTLMVEGKPIYAHQVILASRSTYFEALFTHDFSEKEMRVVDFNDSGISFDQMMQLLKHMYSDNMKIESKFIYDLLSVSATRFVTIFYSLRTGMTSSLSRESVSTYSLSISAWTQCVRSSSMPTTLIASDLRRPVCSLPKRTIRRLLPQLALKSWTRKRCCRLSESIGSRGDKEEARGTSNNRLVSMSKEEEDE